MVDIVEIVEIVEIVFCQRMKEEYQQGRYCSFFILAIIPTSIVLGLEAKFVLNHIYLSILPDGPG